MRYFGTTIRGFKKGFKYFDAILFMIIYVLLTLILSINLIIYVFNNGLVNIWGCLFRVIALYLVICGLPLISKNEFIQNVRDMILS